MATDGFFKFSLRSARNPRGCPDNLKKFFLHFRLF